MLSTISYVETVQEGRCLLADRLASNAAASSRCVAAGPRHWAPIASRGFHGSRQPLRVHTAAQCSNKAHLPRLQHHSQAWASMHHGLASAHGSRHFSAAQHLMQQLRSAWHGSAAASSVQRSSRGCTLLMRLPQAQSTARAAWSCSSRARPQGMVNKRLWHGYAVASYTPRLPGWVRSRLPEMPEGEFQRPAVFSISWRSEKFDDAPMLSWVLQYI